MGVKEYKFTGSFMVFQKEVHAYVLVHYKQPIAISDLIKELKGPITRLTNHMPTINKLKRGWGIDSWNSFRELTEDKNSIVNNLQKRLGPEHKMLVELKSTLEQNLSKLYELVCSQCNRALKEDIIGLDKYVVN